MTTLELAQHVVNQMGYSQLHESAVAGICLDYERDPEKFAFDLENEGFGKKEKAAK